MICARRFRLSLNAEDALLDGEMVKFDSEGSPDLHRFDAWTRALCVLAFDWIAVGGLDVRRLPLLKGKKLLSAIVSRQSSLTTQSPDRLYPRGFRGLP